MITEEEYKEFQKWWKDIIKKPNSIPPNKKIESSNDNIYIKIPDEYNSTFPGILYRKLKQSGALKLYGKTKNGSLKELEEHELCDINRKSKQRKEYIYDVNEWLDDDRNTVMQILDNKQTSVINSIKDSSTFDASQITNFIDIIDDNIINKITKHPRFENYIDSKFKQLENIIKQQLLSIPKKLFGVDRVIQRENSLCAWANKLINREHDKDKNKIYYIPIEVFGDKVFRFHPHHLKHPTKALTNAKNYAICQKCRINVLETDNKFFDSKSRASICGICKNRQTTNKRTGTEYPICEGCTNSSNKGALDKDWDKVLIKKTFEVVAHQFPDLNIQIYPESVVPSLEELGQGNHNKRIDVLVVFNTIKTIRGSNKEGKVAILIELDDQQKSNINIKETINDIKNTIKKKVIHVNTVIKPDILTIWKVNYNTDFYTPTQLVKGFSYYNRMIILRQYLYVMIYHWFELPKQFVLYFWYDNNKMNNIKNYWINNDEEKKYISFVWDAPHDINHLWHYCVDPCEGGCYYFERTSSNNNDEPEISEISDGSENIEKKTQQPNPDKNPYNKIIVENRKILNEIFNFDFPIKNNDFTFSIFSE